jgi:hypothetical protein
MKMSIIATNVIRIMTIITKIENRTKNRIENRITATNPPIMDNVTAWNIYEPVHANLTGERA